MKTKIIKTSKLVANIMFFFDIVLALLVISGARILIDTALGTFSLFFGFAMLFVVVLLKVVRVW